MEELRQQEANLTALKAIGPRKKPKLELGSSPSLQVDDYFLKFNFYKTYILNYVFHVL